MNLQLIPSVGKLAPFWKRRRLYVALYRGGDFYLWKLMYQVQVAGTSVSFPCRNLYICDLCFQLFCIVLVLIKFPSLPINLAMNEEYKIFLLAEFY